MASGDLGARVVPEIALAAERDELLRRLGLVESQVAQLSADLAEARAQLASFEAASTLSLFDDPAPDSLTGDGSDPRVLSLILGATATVAAMVTALALLNGKLMSVFGLGMAAITIALAWAAARTRVVPVEVSVARGIVYVEQGDTTHRFDIRKSERSVEVHGRPGDPDWKVRFPRRGLDPFIIDASMVDPHDFLRQLREYRPEI